jgi:hypothetical protein
MPPSDRPVERRVPPSPLIISLPTPNHASDDDNGSTYLSIQLTNQLTNESLHNPHRHLAYPGALSFHHTNILHSTPPSHRPP